ncbi:hypothetical protein Tco_1351161 [Tanacetum coccineum]
MKGGGVSFPNFLMIRYGSCQFVEALDLDKDPLERCLDEYNWLFHKEIEQLADEYEIKIREEGFICVSGENNETMPLGSKNGSRFRKMIMEETEEVLGNDREDSNDET